MGILFITEFNEFLKVQTTSEMFIDINRGGEKVIINHLHKEIKYMIFIAYCKC